VRAVVASGVAAATLEEADRAARHEQRDDRRDGEEADHDREPSPEAGVQTAAFG
jgi:hypothetical protein